MTALQSDRQLDTASQELDSVISNCMKKVGGRKEKDLCKFLPMSHGGYIHHFTFEKWKTQMPQKLNEMLKNFILQANQPIPVPPKRRAPRGSRKKPDHFVIAKKEIDKILTLARAAGDQELIERILPKRDFRAVKKELLSSIRHNRVEPELWHSYTEALIHEQKGQN